MAGEGLSDLKIVEYGHFISAPFCAKLMADLGADVIKIEEPALGDEARRHGPFYKDNPYPENSGLFMYLNTGKQGITLNLLSATGKRIPLDLLKEADIFIENNSPSVIDELGLTYDVLHKVNPRLIMTSITYFGQTGPYRDYKSSDLVSLAFGGVAFGTPTQVEDPEVEHPLRGGGHQGEFAGGVCGATSTIMPTMPVHLSALPDMEYTRSPLLGEHNDYVFGELLKISQEEIGQLVEERIII